MNIQKMTIKKCNALIACCIALTLSVPVVIAHDELGNKPHQIDVPMNPTAVMKAFGESKAGDMSLEAPEAAMSTTACDTSTNSAGDYPCNNVALHAFMPRNELGGTASNDEMNDIWGWTDPATGNEYAIIGRVFGTSFIDITNPANPVYVGELSTHGSFGSSWRDVKVFDNHAFIVSEALNHGMQVFDLTQLRDASSLPVEFSETAHFSGFGSAHNIVINEESGFAYAVGTNKCSGGLYIVDIGDPANPADAGCYSGDGYTHDAQCVIYRGPDTEHQGKEICFASNEDTLTIVDLSNPANPVQLSRTAYAGSAYTHQGWLTSDHQYFISDDELDEQDFGHNTRTRVFDVADLDNPNATPVDVFNSSAAAIDHNQYVRGRFVFQANYRAGLRVLEIDESSGITLNEVGYFDVYPGSDAALFNGAWSNYPYFPSGSVVISHIEQGLFIVQPNIDSVSFAYPIVHNAVLSGEVNVQINAFDAQGGSNPQVSWELDGLPMAGTTWDTTQETDGLHRLKAYMEDGAGEITWDEILVIVDNGNSGGINTPPIAELTAGQSSAATDTLVELDATESYDPDGDPLSFSWAIIDRPKGKNQSNLVDNGDGTASIAPGKAGTYTIEVTVSDGQVSDTATVSVEVTDSDGPSPCRNPKKCGG